MTWQHYLAYCSGWHLKPDVFKLHVPQFLDYMAWPGAHLDSLRLSRDTITLTKRSLQSHAENILIGAKTFEYVSMDMPLEDILDKDDLHKLMDHLISQESAR